VMQEHGGAFPGGRPAAAFASSLASMRACIGSISAVHEPDQRATSRGWCHRHMKTRCNCQPQAVGTIQY
jgi:hypothetical protein